MPLLLAQSANAYGGHRGHKEHGGLRGHKGHGRHRGHKGDRGSRKHRGPNRHKRTQATQGDTKGHKGLK